MQLEGLQLGHYRLLQLIGSGGMGEVYLAEDPRLHRQVAIKVIRSEAASYPNALISKEAARLFEREARAIAMLDHPNILPLFDYGEENINGSIFTYLVMPFRQEGSFANWLKEHNDSCGLSTEEVAYFLHQAASALQYAHNHQIIHQDVKPSNFLIRNNPDHPHRPDLLLTDFGVAKLTTATSSMSHSIRGTPTYMAPEQWAGDPLPATDQYALAIMTYEMLTGQPPFQGSPMRMMYLHTNTQPQPPSMLNPRLSPEIDAVLLRALAKNPQDRFPSISMFANAFEQAIQNPDMPTLLKAPDTPDSGEKTVLSSDSDYMRRTIPSSNPVSLPPTMPANLTRGQTRQPQGTTRGHKTLILGLVLLVVLASIGIFSFQGINHLIVNNNNAIATTQANDATTFAAKATSTVHANATASVIAQVNATATTIAQNPDLYPPNKGKLVFFDPLNDNSQGHNWDVTPTQFGTCNFADGAYQAVATQDGAYHYCAARQTNFSNFAYEVELIIKTGDCGGIIFRADFTNFKYYYFSICQNGAYEFLVFSGQNRSTTLRQNSFNPAIKTGLGQSNLIAVVANGNTLSLYVNHQQIDSVIDSTYSQGQIGVLSENDTANPTEIIFSNAKVWSF
jgi:eukaryotic-like serine/threonine-protein kinase